MGHRHSEGAGEEGGDGRSPFGSLLMLWLWLCLSPLEMEMDIYRI